VVFCEKTALVAQLFPRQTLVFDPESAIQLAEALRRFQRPSYAHEIRDSVGTRRKWNNGAHFRYRGSRDQDDYFSEKRLQVRLLRLQVTGLSSFEQLRFLADWDNLSQICPSLAATEVQV